MKRLLTLMVLASGLFFQAPTIISTYPAQNALNVPLDAAITVTFDVDMNSATINANTFVVHGSYTGKLSGNYNYDGPSKTATFTPNQPFKVGEQVSVTVTTGIGSAAGDTLTRPLTRDFTVQTTTGSGLFVQAGEIGLGSNPKSVAVGDWDSDGDLDMVICTGGTNELLILINDGFGIFTQDTVLLLENDPFLVKSADMDSDGDLDLFVSSGPYVKIFDNDGTGIFSLITAIAVSGDPRSFSLCDLDADGDIDLLVARRSLSSPIIFMNDGTGSYSQSSTPFVGGGQTFSGTGDWDGDGDIDIVLADDLHYGGVYILVNDGSGSFDKVQTLGGQGSFDIGSSPQSLYIGDVDADGDLDIVVGLSYNSDGIKVLKNDGNGNYTIDNSSGTGNTPFPLELGDWDADGDLDAAVGNGQVHTVSFYTNDGTGTFVEESLLPVGTTPGSLASGDFDGDNDLDLAVANSGSNTVSVLLNLNSTADLALSADTLTFGSAKIGATDTLTFTVYNHGIDSTLQVTGITISNAAFSVSPSSLSILPGDSATVTVTFTPTDMVTYSDSLTIASNDPQQPQVQVYVSGVGDPILSTSPAQNALNVPLDASVSVTFGGDINSATINANTFVVHGGYTGELSGAYAYDSGTKTATFNPTVPFKVGEKVRVTVTRGVQTPVGDGLPEAYSWTFTAEVQGGSGTFAARVNYATSSRPRSVTAADLDGDGDTDLAVANSNGSSVSVLLNLGGGSLPPM